MTSSDDIVRALKAEIAGETGVPIDDIDDSASFASLGLNSISSVFILDKLEKRLKVEMNPLFFWDYPTIKLLADHLFSLRQDHE